LREISDALLDHLLPLVAARDEASAGRYRKALQRLGRDDDRSDGDGRERDA
jgi:hypothetical protein